MKKRLLSILLAVCMILTLVPAAFAAGEVDSAPVAKIESSSGDITEYYSVDDLKNALGETKEYGLVTAWTPKPITDATLTLLADITYPLGTGSGIDLGDNGCLDLNGHILTFSGLHNPSNNESAPQNAYGVALSNQGGTCTIKNGTILMDCSVTENSETEASQTLSAVMRLYGGAINMEYVAILSKENQTLTSAVFAGNITGESGEIVLENCTINVGSAPTVAIYTTDYQEWTSSTGNGDGIDVVSGSYTNLYNSSSLPEHVSISESSSSLTTNPTGVNAGTTVITSANTTAIIVENGNAYLYDTLQDAVNAVENGRGAGENEEATPAIILMKTTSEEVTVGTDTEFKITTNGAGVANSAKFTTEDGYEVKVDESGNVSVAPIVVTSVTVSPSTLNLIEGQTSILTATLQPAGAEGTVAWTSSDTNVATVENGTVKAVGAGTATITATVGEGATAVTAECEVTVSPVPVPATSISLSPASVYVGGSVQLSAAVEPTNSTDTIAWTSSDESIATVDANGVVTGVASGTVTITATANDSVSASCVVTVLAPYVPTPPVTPVQPVNPTPTPGPDPEPDPDPTPGEWTNPYADVSTADWYYDAVAYVSAKGLMTGTTASTFAPSDTMTRAMVWTVLARMEGQSVEGGSPWYAMAQLWAMNAAVSNGVGPNDSITREQLITMLYRQAGSPEVGVPELAKLGQFTDGEAVSDWAQSAMAWAVSNGILTGEDGALNPQASATRGQVAAILMRFCQ